MTKFRQRLVSLIEWQQFLKADAPIQNELSVFTKYSNLCICQSQVKIKSVVRFY